MGSPLRAISNYDSYDCRGRNRIVGARTSEEGTLKIFRVPAKWFVRKLAERLTNADIPDLNSGLRAFRRSVALPYLKLLPPGFSLIHFMALSPRLSGLASIRLRSRKRRSGLCDH